MSKRIKIIDAAWIADKALDLYSERYIDKGGCFTASSVMNIFDDVYKMAIKDVPKTIEKIFFVVSCYPIMVNSNISSPYRYICNKEEFLYSNGISFSHFIDFFEKFIQSKCHDGDATVENNVIWIKNKNALFSDILHEILSEFGNMMCDCSKNEIFANNPMFIQSYCENDGRTNALTDFQRFCIKKSIKNAKN